MLVSCPLTYTLSQWHEPTHSLPSTPCIKQINVSFLSLNGRRDRH